MQAWHACGEHETTTRICSPNAGFGVLLLVLFHERSRSSLVAVTLRAYRSCAARERLEGFCSKGVCVVKKLDKHSL